MPYKLEDLVIDRVDLVDEGANSEAFITLYKRKESSMKLEEIIAGLKPDHAAVVTKALEDKDKLVAKATEDLTTAQSKIEMLEKAATPASGHIDQPFVTRDDDDGEAPDGDNDCDDRKKEAGNNSQSFDEDQTLKAMPAEVRELYKSMQNRLVAAEAAVKKAADEKIHADAIAKAATLKAIPVATDKLVEVIKSATPGVLEILETVSTALEATALSEVGKSGLESTFTKSANAAWEKIEKAAGELAEKNGYTLQKGISEVIAQQPKLYQDYLDGGAN